MKSRSSPLLAPLALLAICAAAGAGTAAVAALAQEPAAARDGDQAPAPEASPATLMLTVQIDATGVGVVQATRKPALAYRPLRATPDMPFAWTMRDGAGQVLATGAFDPGWVCLDPAHRGQPPHVQGCVVTPHATSTNVKVPDLPFASIEFRHGTGAAARPLGSIRNGSFQVR